MKLDPFWTECGKLLANRSIHDNSCNMLNSKTLEFGAFISKAAHSFAECIRKPVKASAAIAFARAAKNKRGERFQCSMSFQTKRCTLTPEPAYSYTVILCYAYQLTMIYFRKKSSEKPLVIPKTSNFRWTEPSQELLWHHGPRVL